MIGNDREESGEGWMTFDEHLSEFRRIFVRCMAIMAGISGVAFVCKDALFNVVLAPSRSDFVLYRWVDWVAKAVGLHSMRPGDFMVRLINTELSSQFMTHISFACYAGLLLGSPYAVYELFRFARPALYERERRYSVVVVVSVYLLFTTGLLMSYFILFPISFRFLGTYQVHEDIVNTITLSSYVSTFILLSFMTGLIFEVPVLAYLLGKFGFITRDSLRGRRRVALVVILIVSAIITPPDLFTLILMAGPLYLLYELSIMIVPERIATGVSDCE